MYTLGIDPGGRGDPPTCARDEAVDSRLVMGLSISPQGQFASQQLADAAIFFVAALAGENHAPSPRRRDVRARPVGGASEASAGPDPASVAGDAANWHLVSARLSFAGLAVAAPKLRTHH